MTPPVLLTPPSTMDVAPADPLNADRAKRNVTLPPLGVLIPHRPTPPSIFAPGPSPSSSNTPISTTSTRMDTSDAFDDDSDASENEYETPLAYRNTVRQWTGAPIRAIVPLPRRKRLVPTPGPTGAQDATPRSVSAPTNVPAVVSGGGTHLWDDADSDDCVAEIDDDDDEDEELEKVRIKGRRNHAPSGSRYCSYESIVATEGLSAWSFEVRHGA